MPLAAAVLAWFGRRALKHDGESRLRDRIRAGTLAAFVIVATYLTPVGWTLVSTNGRPEIGVPVLVLAIAVLVLLFATAEARDALARDL